MIKVIVCGAGQVGFQIAKYLSSEGNKDVVVIDHNPELIAKTTELLDVRGVVGHAAYPEVLDRAGAENADILIAATYSDEVNMIACSVADSVFNVHVKIARVRSQEYLRPEYEGEIFAKLPIPVKISPEIEISRVIMQRLGSPTAFDTARFLDGNVRVIGARVAAGALGANTRLAQLPELFPNLKAHVFAYVRDGKLCAADADDQVFVGDEVYLAAHHEQVGRALQLVGQDAQAIGKTVVIVGGGNIGLRVAKELEAIRARPKLIERDRAKAERAAEALERTIVFHGDGLASEMLAEAEVETAEAIVALTDDDKVNVLSCALAKAMGCPRALALTNDPGFEPLAEPLRVDAFFNPRAVTVSSILRHIRHGPINVVHAVRDGQGEIVEATVKATSPISGAKVRNLETPASARLLAVLSRGRLVMPSPDLTLQDDDRLVMFALHRDINELYHLFRVSLLY